jgi:bilirubin oxidase
MHRRGFLAVGLATVLASPRALAQMKMDDMPGTDMSGHAGHDMGPIPQGAAMLPEGEVLRDLSLLTNEAGQPGLFKARLTAEPAIARFAEGRDTPILAYNGMSPGPLIEAFEGDRVEITFANRIDGEASTIHWHGMPVPADQDGNPMNPVATGGERSYSFVLPEGSAGSYWYHPHPHGKTAEQVYRGLAGAFVVKSKADPIPAEYGDTVLVFTDLRLAADGSIPDNTMTDLMNGRIGDHVLVNGQKNPRLAVAMGARRRLRFYNATNARFLKLAFDGAPMTIIGTDGGLLEAPVTADEILLSPGERIELVVSFDKPGPITLYTLDYDRGWMGAGRPTHAGLTLLTVDVYETLARALPPLPARLRPIAPLSSPVLSRRLVFTETMAMNASGMAFLINGKAFDMGRVDIVARVGETELWEIVNQADMDHPFHVHGTQFQVIEHERDGKVSRPPYLAWKDTVNVAGGETVRLLLRQERPGQRMYHCHILEHEQLGMMGVLDVRA